MTILATKTSVQGCSKTTVSCLGTLGIFPLPRCAPLAGRSIWNNFNGDHRGICFHFHVPVGATPAFRPPGGSRSRKTNRRVLDYFIAFIEPTRFSCNGFPAFPACFPGPEREIDGFKQCTPFAFIIPVEKINPTYSELILKGFVALFQYVGNVQNREDAV